MENLAVIDCDSCPNYVSALLMCLRQMHTTLLRIRCRIKLQSSSQILPGNKETHRKRVKAHSLNFSITVFGHVLKQEMSYLLDVPSLGAQCAQTLEVFPHCCLIGTMRDLSQAFPPSEIESLQITFSQNPLTSPRKLKSRGCSNQANWPSIWRHDGSHAGWLAPILGCFGCDGQAFSQLKDPVHNSWCS